MGLRDRIISLFGKSSVEWLPYRLYNTRTQFNDLSKENEKIEAILTNPAALKVFSLQCDLFSLGKVYVYRDGVEKKNDPALTRLFNPNPKQSQSQFLWDFMFWTMLGTSYCYVDSDLVTNESNKLYFLDTSKLEFPTQFEKDLDKIILSARSEREAQNTVLKYRYNDGSMLDVPISKLVITTDLTNGLGNWYKGPSRVDALYKIISNSEAALDSENINIRYAGKFMVAGKADPDNVTQMPMGEIEKKDIETKMNGKKSVHAVKSMIDIKRFVEDRGALELGAAYLEAYFLIGSMYGIPRDVLEAYNSSTYENQEKARASHVSYTLQPKGNDFMAALAKRWGYDARNREIVISWDHLPFMQVFENERVKTKKAQAETFKLLLDQGVALDEVNEFLDTEFKTGEKNEQSQIINQPTTVTAEAGN